MKIIAILIFSAAFLLKNGFSFAGGIDKGKEQIKILNAKDKFVARDYRSALELYRDLLTDHKEDATFNLRVGQCLLELNQADIALEYFEKALKLKSDVDANIQFYIARGYHRSGQIDKALEAFGKFKSTVGAKKCKELDLDYYIVQCNTAKELISRPINVKIENMGGTINSEYDDYAPSIAADGKTMIFTSRRADTKGGLRDMEYDKKFFEDIYISNWNDEKKKWDDAEPIKGSLNTEGHDACLSMSPDGKMIFVYRNIEDETRSGDIYISKLTSSEKWGSPHSAGPIINSSYFESSASLSADGNTMYFVSERKGGEGNSDIWMSTKVGHDWSEAVNMGKVINTVEDEISVYIHPDGKTLFFSSKGHNSMGGFDIFKSTLDEKGVWSKPENIGYPINTVNDDIHFSLSTDKKSAYYSTNITGKGFGERDIYKIDMSNYFGKSAVGELSIFQGKILDAKTGIETEAQIVVKPEDGSGEGVTSNVADGNYFFTLPGGKKYTVIITKNGYNDYTETIDLPAGKAETFILNKSFSVEKKQ